jgi:serine/threonine-protein kinase RsbW
MADRTIATLRLTGAGDLGSVARATVAAGAAELGLDGFGAGRLAEAAALVVAAVASKAFDDVDDVDVTVALTRREGGIVVCIDDRGLPFAYRDEDDAFARVLSDALVDEAHHESRGIDGNRTELVRHVDDAHHDVRTTADPAEHAEAVAAPEVDASVELTIRPMEPDDAESVARLTWRTYGYSYQHHEFYRPDLLRAVLEDGTMRSWVGAAPDGEIVGHTALVFDQAGALVAEGGRAMVDPRYRGHHVAKSLTNVRGGWMDEAGLFGHYADAVTLHTRSQALYGGAEQPVTGVLLGYLPPTVTFKRIQAEAVPQHRQAVVMSYHPRRPHDPLIVYPPDVAADVLRRIYEAHDLPRSFGEGEQLEGAGPSAIETRVWADLDTALLVVNEPGADLRDVAHAHRRAMGGLGIPVVYADLPLAHPRCAAAGAVLSGLGFTFGGVIPLLRDGTDVLRMQHLGDLEVDPSEIQLVSTMAKELLAFILARREAVT